MSSNKETNLKLELSLGLGGHGLVRVTHQLLFGVGLVLGDVGPG